MSSDQRAEVAAAFALDTAAAALACESVHAVLAITDDHRFARRLAALGCSVIPDGSATISTARCVWLLPKPYGGGLVACRLP